VPLFIGRLKNE